MDDKSSENSQFSFKDDIFSQYDDNFATEDCLKSYESNIGTHDVKISEDSNKNKEALEPTVSQTKIIPTFGKQKQLKKDAKKPAKAKKFIAPIKKTMNNENSPSNNNVGPTEPLLEQPTPKPNLDMEANPDLSQDFETLNTNSLLMQYKDTIGMALDSNIPQITDFNNIYTYPNMLSSLDDSMNIASMDIFNKEQRIEKVDNAIENINTSKDKQEKNKIINKRVSLPQRMKSNIVGSIISSSLNILDDQDIIATENLSLEANSDQLSVKNLSQTENQSFCSVTSLNKTYKNLDCNSFQNGCHKIPAGNEFLELFKNNIPEKVKPIAMSTEFGDMGFNTKYSEYIKDFGLIYEETEEEKDTVLKIINMYPKENSILKKKLSK